MNKPSGRIEQSLIDFMWHVPTHIAPVLYRADYCGRQLPESEVMALMVLHDQGPQSPTSISRLLNMQKGSLTSVLKRLEKLGLIARRAHPADERSHMVELSSEGLELMRAVRQRIERDLKSLFETMAPPEKQTAALGLDMIGQYFRKLEEEKMAQAQRASAKSLNWYHAASPEDRKEYDAFGPWLTEIETEADMPRCFRSLYQEHAHAKYLIKLPKNADRRNLRPGMDLYDAILAVDEEGVFLARLEESGVWTQHASWDEIAAISSYGDRLEGVWTLYLKDGNHPSLTFNRVSTDLMDMITDKVRHHLMGQPVADMQNAEEMQEEFVFSDDNLFFGSSLLELRHRPGGPFNAIHFEPQGQHCVDQDGHDAVSTGVLFLESAKEMVIINRSEPCHKAEEPWYAGKDLFIPFDRITSCQIIGTPNASLGQFCSLEIGLGEQVITQPCLEVPQQVVASIMAHCPSLA